MIKSWKRGFEAARVARLHSNGERPGRKLGAALFSGSNLISVGFNTYGKTHPRLKYATFEKNVHAEHNAIIKRQYYTNSNLVIYVYREDHAGNPVCSRPCSTCLSILTLANVRKVRYIDEKGQFVELTLSRG